MADNLEIVEGNMNSGRILVRKPEGSAPHPDVGCRILLNSNLGKYKSAVWSRFIWLSIRKIDGLLLSKK
jgi:hypothetical protein